MRMPLDTSRLACFALGAPEPVWDRQADRQRSDREGRPLVQVQVAVKFGAESEVWTVRTTGEPAPGVDAGVPVVLEGLVVVPWEMQERSGLAFRAEQVRPVPAVPKGGEPKSSRAAS